MNPCNVMLFFFLLEEVLCSAVRHHANPTTSASIENRVRLMVRNVQFIVVAGMALYHFRFVRNEIQKLMILAQHNVTPMLSMRANLQGVGLERKIDLLSTT